MLIIAPEGDTSRILAQTELPEILKNADVTEIDGIPREQLLEYARQHGDAALRHFVFDHSHIKVYLSGLVGGNVDGYLNFLHRTSWVRYSRTRFGSGIRRPPSMCSRTMVALTKCARP